MSRLREPTTGRKKYGYVPKVSPSRIRRRQDTVDTQTRYNSAKEGVSDGALHPHSADADHEILVSVGDGIPVQTPMHGAVGLDPQYFDTREEYVEADTPAPPVKAKRGRPRKAVSSGEGTGDDLAKTVILLRRHLYSWRQVVTQRVSTINRLRSVCRMQIVNHHDLPTEILYNKGDEIKRLGLVKEQAFMMKEAGALYAALMDDDKTHELVPQTLMFYGALVSGITATEHDEAAIVKAMASIAKNLPVAKWAEEQHGFSMAGLAKIIGYAGDLNRFCDPDTKRIVPSKLWKFMELAVIDGGRQRRIGGEEALVHKYKGHKRSLMWNIGGSLIGGMGRGPRLDPDQDIQTADLHPWQRRFYRHMRFYADRNPELHAKPIGESGKESFSKHAWAMSKRRVEKEFLVALQIAWNDATKTKMPA